jgi:hypothetical protein
MSRIFKLHATAGGLNATPTAQHADLVQAPAGTVSSA